MKTKIEKSRFVQSGVYLENFKPSKKQIGILNAIQRNGIYKPKKKFKGHGKRRAFTDKEPCVIELIELGVVKWNEDITGVILTKTGSEFISNKLNTSNC